MFRKDADFEAFGAALWLRQFHATHPRFIVPVMSNHWHFVVWPEQDGQLTDFFRRLGVTRMLWLPRFAPTRDTGISIRDALRVSRFRVTTICCRCYVMLSGTPCPRDWSRGAQLWRWFISQGRVHGGRKRSSPCYRPGQWSGRQTGRLASTPVDGERNLYLECGLLSRVGNRMEVVQMIGYGQTRS